MLTSADLEHEITVFHNIELGGNDGVKGRWKTANPSFVLRCYVERLRL